MTRTDWLRFNTQIIMRRHRVIRWTPMAPPVKPEWMRRNLTRDMTGPYAETELRALWGDR